ncbi:hypothetical protein M9Y10_017650 [Tritrichomonas musculus]|uniref:Chorein N-terminal domain-containing protein n=1 Tax=Tritrichomonas musculus TaxID=1915356 RepID=A0ABR2HU68_9EUKA
MVLEKVASSLLSFFLTKYIDKVNTNALKMSLFTGKVSLDNLSVKKAALMQHKLPFKIIRGIVKKIYVSIPYIRLKSKPTLAGIENILVLGKLSEKTIEEAEQLSTSESDISDEFNSIDSALKEQKVSKFDFTAGLVGAIIENLQVKVTNIHVRLEYEFDGKTVAIGLIVPLIQVMSIDENGNEVDTNSSKTMIRKKLILSNLSLYVDTKTERYKQKMKDENIEFEKMMLDSMSSESHQFILHNFTFETIYEHAKSGQGPVTVGNIIDVTTSAIKLALDSFQYQCFTQIMAQQSRYMIKKFFSSCGKPNSLPERDADVDDCILWWRFAERCSEKKNEPFRFNPTTALIFLKNRNKNLAKLSDILINPNKKKDEKYLKGLQEEYGGDVFLMFRAYAKFRTEKDLREKKHREMEEMKKKNKNEIDQDAKEIQELLSSKNNIKNNADTWRIKCKVNEIDLGLLLTPSTYLAMLEWRAWEGTFKKNKDDIDFEALIGGLSIVNMRSKQHTRIIELIQSETSKGGSATINIAGNLASKIFRIDSHISSPHLFADLSIIKEVQMFLSGSSGIHVEGSVPKVHKRDHTHAETLNLIDTHPKLFIDLHLDSPVVTVPYRMPIEIQLGNVDIKSIKPDRKRSVHHKDSWYDEYSLDLTGFQILMGKKKLCRPVTFSLNCLQSFIRKSSMVMTIAKTNITSMDFDMNHRQYQMLLQLPDYISTFIQHPKKHAAVVEEDHKKDEVHPSKKKKGTINTVDSLVSDLSIQLNIDFEEVGLRLFNSRNNVGSELKIAGISTSVKALENKAEGTFVLQYIKILGDKNQCICNFGDDKVPAINIGVNTEGIVIALTMHTSKPIIDVDFNWLGLLLKFVIVPETSKEQHKAIEAQPPSTKNDKKADSKSKEEKEKEKGKQKHINQYQLLRKLETHPIFKIDVSFAGPTINLPCGESKINIDLGLLHIFTKEPIPRDQNNIESFYDMLTCEFNNFEIHLGDEYLLDPFSLSVEAHKAFVTRHDVESLKIYADIHELKVQMKRSQFLSLLTVVDSVKGIIPSSDKQNDDDSDDEKEKHKDKKHDHDNESHKSAEQKIPKSMFINLKFEALVIDLLNEDNSINTGFTINQLESTFNSFQDDLSANLKIVVLKGVFDDETLLSFGENDIPSFNFIVHNNKEITNADICISKPTILVDFQWIVQLERFFEMPNKASTKQKFYQIVDSSHDSVSKTREISRTDSQQSEVSNTESQLSVMSKNDSLQSNISKDSEEANDKKDIQVEEEEEDNEKSANKEEESKNEEKEEKDEKSHSEEEEEDKKDAKVQNVEYKVREVSSDVLNKMSSDNLEKKSETGDPNASRVLSQNEIVQNQSVPVEKESSSSSIHSKSEEIEPKHSKKIPMNYIWKGLLILLPLIVFHRYLFNFKFLSLLLVSGGASYYIIHKRKRKSVIVIDARESPKLNQESTEEEKSKQEPSEQPKEEVTEQPKEESTEENEEDQNNVKVRAVDLLEAAGHLSETTSNESIQEKPLTLFEQLQKVQGKFVITEPSITVLLVKKTKEIIKMNTKIQELDVRKDDNQNGSFLINGFQILMDDRYLMKPFDIKVGINLQSTITVKVGLPAIVLKLQTFDYQLLLEVGEYIPAVLKSNRNKKVQIANSEETMNSEIVSESQTSTINDSQSTQSKQLALMDDNNKEDEEEEIAENSKFKLPFVLDLNLDKIGVEIFEEKKKLFNFYINSIILASSIEGKFDLTVTSIICQEHISSKNNKIISFATPTFVNLSELGDLSVSVSPDATIFVKMEAVNDLLDIFLPGEQILDYEKPKKIEHKKKHKHKHHHKKKKHHKDKKHKLKSKEMTISVESKCFKVVFLDESEIATLSLIKITYEKTGIDQTIKVFDIALTDPKKSDLYPSEMLSSEKGKAFSLELSKRETSIRINRLIIFANLNVISRVINTVVKNPLKLPPPKSEPTEEEEEEKDDEEEKQEEEEKEKDQKDVKDVDVDSDNSKIVKKDDPKLEQDNSETEEFNESEKEKPKKKTKELRIRFKYINITIPVSFNESNEILDFTIDGHLSISSRMKLSVRHITTKFIQYKGAEHPPFIPNISFHLVKNENDIDLLMKPALISIALDDIAAAGLLANSLGKFVSHLNLPHDDGIPKEKKKDKEGDHKVQDFSLSVEMKKLQLVLNSDRYQTVPLFRLIFKQFAIKYANQKPSSIHCVFDHIDFMDIQYLTWKMLLESFSLNINLLITEDLISVDSSIELPININFAYQAIQLILSHIQTISKTVSHKQLIDSKPPSFKIVNNCSKDVSINNIETGDSIEIKPGMEDVCNFKRDEELEIKIGDDSKRIITSKLQYPTFVEFQAVSQKLLESGTILQISSVILFENQTKFNLFLFQQKTILIHRSLIVIPAGKQIPYTDIESLKTMSFALTTEEDSLKSAHSSFTVRDVKRRAVLLSCVFPNKWKCKLVVSSKFDPLTCAMIIKIQPNCIIHNQLPLHLFIRSDESDDILHLKPGDSVKTTIIDTSGLEFAAYFAVSSFGESVDETNVTVKKLKNKVNVKTSDGFISSVPLISINASPDEKPSKICFAIEAKKSVKRPQYDLVCFAPSLIFNLTGMQLNCYNKIREKKYIVESFSPREKGSDPNEDGCLIWSSEEYFKRKDTSRKLSLQLSTDAESERKYCHDNIASNNNNQLPPEDPETKYMGDDVIECLATHINGPVMLPTQNPDIFIPLHYTVASAQPYASSTLVTITSKFAICNHASKPFFIQPIILPKPEPPKNKKPLLKKKSKNKKSSKKKNKGAENATEDTETENVNETEAVTETETDVETDTETGNETESETESTMTKHEKKKKEKKKHHFKLHKKSHAKTSDETDAETDFETDNESATEAENEKSQSKEKKKKKKLFHIKKSRKSTHAKTDESNDNNTDNATEDETSAVNEDKKKKKKKFKGIRIKKRKDKKEKKDKDDITSDLESTTVNDTETDNDDDETSATPNVPAVDVEEFKKKLKFGDPIKIENNGKNQQIRLAAEGLLYAFKVDPNSSKYTTINFSEPIHTTFAHEGHLFEIENQTLGVESLIIIKDAVFPQPLNLLNDLRIGTHKVYVTQKSLSKSDTVHKSKAMPQSMTIVAYDVPFGGTDLILHYKKHRIPINLIRVNTPIKKHHIYYEVIVNKNNTKTIVVSKIPYEHAKKTNLQFHVNIPIIAVSLIDKLNHEFALLTLQRLEFGMEIGKVNKIMFNLGAFQLDDLQPSAMLKVVIAAYPDVPEGEDIKTKNLLEFSTTMFADTPLFTACHDLTLLCDPIILFVDLSFLSDTISLMQNMFLVENKNKGVSGLLAKPKPSQPSSLSSIPLTAENLTIGEIKFTIFVRAQSSRPNLYKPVSYFLRAVPDITNGQIVLPSFHFEDCTMNAAYIEKEIVHPLIDAGIKQGLKLLFNTDIFMRSTGTKSASFAKKGEKLMNGQLQVLVQVPGSMILQGGETGLNVASKFLHNISFSRGGGVNRVNATAKDTMNSGVKALGHGFADAFTGIVKDPMKEQEKKGVGGVFIGIGKGLLGLITKPVAGILDASVASISAMRKKLNGEDDDVIPPLRIAHALPMKELDSYNDKMMVIKDVAQLSFQVSDIQELYTQYVERYVIDNETSDWYGVTQEFVFWSDKEGTLKKKSRIRDISSIQYDKDTHVITMEVNEISIKLYEIHVQEEEKANIITEMINSRRMALGIGE